MRPFEDRLEEWITDTEFLTDNDIATLTRTFFHSILKTESTRQSYFKAIKRFFAHALTPEQTTLHHIDTDVVQNHIDSIGAKRPVRAEKDTHLSARALSLAALRRYFGYLKRKGELTENPADDASLTFPRHSTGKTRALEPHQVMAILNAIETDTPQGRRDAALIAFLAFTACRVGGALNLTHNGLAEDGSLSFFEKGARQHTMPMPPDLPRYLNPYLGDLIYPEPHEPVFRTFDTGTRRFTAEQLPYIEAYMIVRRRAKAAGIKGDVHPHCFRATAITEMLDAGMPLHHVKTYANHKRLDTTLLYDRKARVKPEHTEMLSRIYAHAKPKK